MCEETGEYLFNKPDGVYFDCTLGGGGHSLYLLEKYPEIKIIGLDVDNNAIEEASKKLFKFKDRIKILRENFCNIGTIAEKLGLKSVDGIFADLGVSSRQLDDESKGFSFRSANLDMRMDQRLEKSAEDIVNTFDSDSLSKIFKEFGEERFADKIARKIVEERKSGKIISGKTLAEIIEKAKRRDGAIHPATRVFQALRIYVNKELENLESFLNQLPDILNKGGRAVVISYHSLEDRIVKNIFRDKAKSGVFKLLTKKVITPGEEEIRRNSRSRSAKLRAAEKV